jgi:ADP-L-glycero-D-manno-heptose 6-epimerase
VYVVTGGAGFIGSALVWQLNRQGIDDILVVDDAADPVKGRNLRNCRYWSTMPKGEFLERVRRDDLPGASGAPGAVEAVLHMGACSATTQMDREYLRANNTDYTRALAEWALERGIRFVYASSAATYGAGERGFSDADAVTPTLRPLNPYGESKQNFDRWVLEQGVQDRLVGLKFFNVFGPNEYHKGDMASFVFKAVHQIRETGGVRLFRSHRPDFADGEQRRDFVYVKDCTALMAWLLEHPEVGGLFNVGTGQARTWKDLVAAVGAALGVAPRIEFVDLPPAIREGYQYHTEAEMGKLRAAGYRAPFTPLEEAVADYVRNHLLNPDPYLDPAAS